MQNIIMRDRRCLCLSPGLQAQHSVFPGFGCVGLRDFTVTTMFIGPRLLLDMICKLRSCWSSIRNMALHYFYGRDQVNPNTVGAPRL